MAWWWGRIPPLSSDLTILRPVRNRPEINTNCTWFMHLRNVFGFMMPSCNPHLCKEERSVLSFAPLAGFTLITYFLIMDIIMFVTVQSTPSLVNPKSPLDGHYSVFQPLTTKHVMSDHLTTYVLNPSVEYFNVITNFSNVCYFITPNMISYFHLFVALICAKLVSSLSLSNRRIGAVLFCFRTWLDSLDGVVFRSRKGMGRLYHSERNTSGYYVDALCDGFGGVFLSFGVLFYFFKLVDNKNKELPYTKLVENGNGSGQKTNLVTQYSKWGLFWKMWCAGFMCGVAASAWDYSVDQMNIVLSTKLTDPKLEVVQSAYLHSVATWFVMWLWKLCEGQVFISYILLAIIIDKIWEYVNFIQYIGYVIILSVFMINLFYVKHMKADLHIV